MSGILFVLDGMPSSQALRERLWVFSKGCLFCITEGLTSADEIKQQPQATPSQPPSLSSQSRLLRSGVQGRWMPCPGRKITRGCSRWSRAYGVGCQDRPAGRPAGLVLQLAPRHVRRPPCGVWASWGPERVVMLRAACSCEVFQPRIRVLNVEGTASALEVSTRMTLDSAQASAQEPVA